MPRFSVPRRRIASVIIAVLSSAGDYRRRHRIVCAYEAIVRGAAHRDASRFRAYLDALRDGGIFKRVARHIFSLATSIFTMRHV